MNTHPGRCAKKCSSYQSWEFVELVSEKELRSLMETFEQKEKALPLGDFEKMVVEVAGIEKAFGLDDLARFTPKSSEI